MYCCCLGAHSPAERPSSSTERIRVTTQATLVQCTVVDVASRVFILSPYKKPSPKSPKKCVQQQDDQILLNLRYSFYFNHYCLILKFRCHLQCRIKSTSHSSIYLSIRVSANVTIPCTISLDYLADALSIATFAFL